MFLRVMVSVYVLRAWYFILCVLVWVLSLSLCGCGCVTCGWFDLFVDTLLSRRVLGYYMEGFCD